MLSTTRQMVVVRMLFSGATTISDSDVVDGGVVVQ